MFGIGFTELVIIAVIALMVLGPERLPEVARQLGVFVRDLRRMYNNLRADLGPEFDEIEHSIRELRSMDPRQQIRSYGRDLLTDLSADAPEIKQIAAAPRINLDQLSRSVLRDDLLDRPIAETTGQNSSAAEPATPPTPQPAAPPNETAESRPIETTGQYE